MMSQIKYSKPLDNIGKQKQKKKRGKKKEKS